MSLKKIAASHKDSVNMWPSSVCTPLCPKPTCDYEGKHSEIVMVLVRCTNIPNQEKEFQQCLQRYKKQGWLYKDCVPDKAEELRYPLVHWACILGKHIALEVLVEKGFDLSILMKNAVSNVKQNALFSMARQLRQGTNPKLTDAQVAYLFGNVFEVFLKHNSQVIAWQEEGSGDSILHFCCKQGVSNSLARLYLQEILKRIKSCKPGLSDKDKIEILGVKNKEGNNLVHELVQCTNCPGVLYFSENMGDVFGELSRAKNLASKTPRQVAVEKQSVEMLKALGAPEVVINSVVKAACGAQQIRGDPNARQRGPVPNYRPSVPARNRESAQVGKPSGSASNQDASNSAQLQNSNKRGSGLVNRRVAGRSEQSGSASDQGGSDTGKHVSSSSAQKVQSNKEKGIGESKGSSTSTQQTPRGSALGPTTVEKNRQESCSIVKGRASTSSQTTASPNGKADKEKKDQTSSVAKKTPEKDAKRKNQPSQSSKVPLATSLLKQADRKNATKGTEEKATSEGGVIGTEKDNINDTADKPMEEDNSVHATGEPADTSDISGDSLDMDDADMFLDLADTVGEVMFDLQAGLSGIESEETQAATKEPVQEQVSNEDSDAVSSTRPKVQKSAEGSGSPKKKHNMAAISTPNSSSRSDKGADSLPEVSSSDQTSASQDRAKKRSLRLLQSSGKSKSKKRRVMESSDSEDEDVNFHLELQDDSEVSDESPDEEEEAITLPPAKEPKGRRKGHTPFCTAACAVQHHSLLLSLVECSNHTSNRTSRITVFLDELDRYLQPFERFRDVRVNSNIPDPLLEFQFPLIHWASVLGKYRVLENLAYRKEVNFAVKAERTGETALHRTLLYLDESCSSAELRFSSKRITEMFSEVLNVLTNRKAVVLTLTNKEDDTPFHTLAKAIVDCTGKLDRLNCFEGYFSTMLAKLRELEKRSKLQPGSAEKVLTKQNLNQETFLHILVCREGVAHRMIKKVVKELDSSILHSLKTKVNREGKTPSDIAEALGSHEMAEFLTPLSQKKQAVPAYEVIEVKVEADDVEQIELEPADNSMNSSLDPDSQPDSQADLQLDSQPQPSIEVPGTSSEGVEIRSSDENHTHPAVYPATSSHSFGHQEGVPAIAHEEDCKFCLVTGIMSSSHPNHVKKNVIVSLQSGLQEGLIKSNRALQEIKDGLTKATDECAELAERKQALLAELEEITITMAQLSRDKENWEKKCSLKEGECLRHEKQLKKCENALRALEGNL